MHHDLCDRRCFVGSHRQRVENIPVTEGVVSLLHRGQHLDHRGGSVALEWPILAVVRRQRLGVFRCCSAQDRKEVGHAGLGFDVEAHMTVIVGDSTFDLLLDPLGLVENLDRARFATYRFGHLLIRALQVHHPGTGRRNPVFGNYNGSLAVAAVHPQRHISGEFNVLPLVVTDRHDVGVVQQNVCSLQRWVGEQPCADGSIRSTSTSFVALGQTAQSIALVLELGHAAQLAEAGEALHQPPQLGVLMNVALDKDGAEFGVEAYRQKHPGHVDSAGSNFPRFFGKGESVEINDAVHRVCVVLKLFPVAQRTQVVAQVGRSGRLDSTEYPWSLCTHFEKRRMFAVTSTALSPTAEGNAHASGPSVKVETAGFEGPFDLLLHLILNDKVDLYEVSLFEIVDAYLAEVKRMKNCDLEVATEFLLIAATLIELKVRRLLPEDVDIDLDEEFALWEERDLLLSRLLESKTFKDAAAAMVRMSENASRVRPRIAGLEEHFIGLAPDLLENSTPHDLHSAFMKAMQPKPATSVGLQHVTAIKASVSDAINEMLGSLPQRGPKTFKELTAHVADDTMEVVVRFLAVLELFKQGAVDLEQVGHLGDLRVEWVGSEDDRQAALTGIDTYDG